MQSQEITPEFFIKPGVDLQEGAQEYLTMVHLSKSQLQQRWLTSEGQYILSRWKGNKFDRNILDGLVGKWYGHTDIRGIPLAGENLEKVDLSKVDLYSSNLENTVLSYANLNESYFSECNIKNTRFDWAQMDKVYVDNVEFNKKTSFLGVDLNSINFALAILLQDLAIRQQRIINLETKRPAFARFLKITCDYGRSFPRFFCWCLVVILVFSLAYTFIPGSLNQTGFWNSLYFSGLTFMTMSFNDIQPMSVFGKVLALIEGASGFGMTALLIAIFLRGTIGD